VVIFTGKRRNASGGLPQRSFVVVFPAAQERPQSKIQSDKALSACSDKVAASRVNKLIKYGATRTNSFRAVVPIKSLQRQSCVVLPTTLTGDQAASFAAMVREDVLR